MNPTWITIGYTTAIIVITAGWLARINDGRHTNYHRAAFCAVMVATSVRVGSPVLAAAAGAIAAGAFRDAWYQYRYGHHPGYDVTVTFRLRDGEEPPPDLIDHDDR